MSQCIVLFLNTKTPSTSHYKRDALSVHNPVTQRLHPNPKPIPRSYESKEHENNVKRRNKEKETDIENECLKQERFTSKQLY